MQGDVQKLVLSSRERAVVHSETVLSQSQLSET
jgi:hypothetical protein